MLSSHEPPPVEVSDLGDVVRELECAHDSLGRILKSIALELEITNHLTMLHDFTRCAAVDKKLLPDVERARLDLNAALARRSQ